MMHHKYTVITHQTERPTVIASNAKQSRNAAHFARLPRPKGLAMTHFWGFTRSGEQIQYTRVVFTIFFSVYFAAALFLPVISGAQNTAPANLPSDQSNATEKPGVLVNNFYTFALSISGLLAFGAIVWGGIQYTASAGSPSGQSEGKEWIKGALWGLLLLAGAYLILNTINPDIVGLELAAPNSGGTE